MSKYSLMVVTWYDAYEIQETTQHENFGKGVKTVSVGLLISENKDTITLGRDYFNVANKPWRVVTVIRKKDIVNVKKVKDVVI